MTMKRNKFLVITLLLAISLTTITSCTKDSFDDVYRDPSKVTETSIEKQFTGILYTYREFVILTYRNYFVTLSPTIHRYIQTIGWENESNHLTPGMAAIVDRWDIYYKGLAQFKEFENLYLNLPEEEKEEKKIFYLAAKVFFYDQTQQQVDLFGDIPWSEAGQLSKNGGDYSISYPKYDKAQDIYTHMLDDLKEISQELNAIDIPSVVATSFATQDLINSGEVELWKKYTNSLRLRMLTRVSAAPDFASRASQELNEIVSDPVQYPIVLNNDDNIQIDIYDISSDISPNDFDDALESWNNNISGGKMIDHMNDNEDPRLPFIFEPGEGANGDFIGLDQSLPSGTQASLISGSANNPSTIAIYNRSTYSRNENFPGILITASEVHFLLAEYYDTNNQTEAQNHFETGIKESVEMYRKIREISNNNTAPTAPAPTTAEIDSYIAKIGWGINNIERIATQKWLHFNIVQSIENWSEVRRLDYPEFAFQVRNSDNQKTAPVKFNLPHSERANNLENYNAVKDQDNVNTKLFWDVN